MDYGAIADDGNDDSPAIRNALAAIRRAGGTGRLMLPAGVCDLERPVDMEGGAWRLEVVGAGAGVSTLQSAKPDVAASGIARFFGLKAGSAISLRDMTLMSAGGGTALEVEGAPGKGNGVDLTVNHVEIRGMDESRDGFRVGVHATRISRLALNDFRFMSPSSRNGLPAAEAAVDLTGVAGEARMENCRLTGARYGLRARDLFSDARLFFLRGQMVGCVRGMDIEASPNTRVGQVTVDGCHCAVDEMGFRFVRLENLRFANNSFLYGANASVPEYIDVSIEDCGKGEVMGNIFSYPARTSRVMLSVDERSGPVHVAECVFQSLGTPIRQGRDADNVVEARNLMGAWTDPQRQPPLPPKLRRPLSSKPARNTQSQTEKKQ